MQTEQIKIDHTTVAKTRYEKFPDQFQRKHMPYQFGRFTPEEEREINLRVNGIDHRNTESVFQ